MTFTRKSAIILTTAISALAASSITQAYEKGDIILRAGLALVEPNEESTSIKIDQPGLGYVSGARVGVDNNVQLGLTGTYMLTDHVGLGLLAATPFKHDIVATGTIAGVGKLGETKHLPPTLTAQYFLGNPDDAFQPYVGLGLNYTLFFSEKTSDTLTGAIGTLASISETPTNGVVATSSQLELSNSFGAALEVGFDYKITENIAINASYWYISIETDADITAQTNAGVVKASTSVKIDPHAYFVGASYLF